MKPKRKYRLRKYYDGGVNDNELVQTIPQTMSSPYASWDFQNNNDNVSVPQTQGYNPYTVDTTQQQTQQSLQQVQQINNGTKSGQAGNALGNTLPIVGLINQVGTAVAGPKDDRGIYKSDFQAGIGNATNMGGNVKNAFKYFKGDVRDDKTTAGNILSGVQLLFDPFGGGMRMNKDLKKQKAFEENEAEQKALDEKNAAYQEFAQNYVTEQDKANNNDNKYNVQYNQNLAYAAKGGKIRNSRMMSRRESEKAMPMFYDKNYFLKYFHSLKRKYPYGGEVGDPDAEAEYGEVVKPTNPNEEPYRITPSTVMNNDGSMMTKNEQLHEDVGGNGMAQLSLNNGDEIFTNRGSVDQESSISQLFRLHGYNTKKLKTIADYANLLIEKKNDKKEEFLSNANENSKKANDKNKEMLNEQLFAYQESQKQQGTHVMPDGSIMNNSDMQTMADGGKINFKSKSAYNKWLGYGHATGVFKNTQGNQDVSIKGKEKKVLHKYQYGGTNPPYSDYAPYEGEYAPYAPYTENQIVPSYVPDARYIDAYKNAVSSPRYYGGVDTPAIKQDYSGINPNPIVSNANWNTDMNQPSEILRRGNPYLKNDVVTKDPSIPIRDEGEFRVAGSEMPESGGYRTPIIPSAISAAAGTLPLLYQASLKKKYVKPDYLDYKPLNASLVDYTAGMNEAVRNKQRPQYKGTGSNLEAQLHDSYSSVINEQASMRDYERFLEAQNNMNSQIKNQTNRINLQNQYAIDADRKAEDRYVTETNATEDARKQENIMALLSGSANNANQFLQDYQGARMQDYAINNLMIAGDYKWNAKTSKWEYLPGASKTTNYSGANTAKSTNANTFTEIPTPLNPNYVQQGLYAPYSPLLNSSATPPIATTGSSNYVPKKLSEEELKQSQRENPFVYPNENIEENRIEGNGFNSNSLIPNRNYSISNNKYVKIRNSDISTNFKTKSFTKSGKDDSNKKTLSKYGEVTSIDNGYMVKDKKTNEIFYVDNDGNVSTTKPKAKPIMLSDYDKQKLYYDSVRTATRNKNR